MREIVDRATENHDDPGYGYVRIYYKDEDYVVLPCVDSTVSHGVKR